MTVIIKIEDVFEVAVRIERKGIEFYRLAHEKVHSNAAKDVFAFLVSQEEKHLGTFQAWLEKAADYLPRFKYPGRLEAFYRDVANHALESLKNVEAALAAKSLREALEIAKTVEKESIAYYEGMSQAFPGEQEQRQLRQVINEEKEHLARLELLGENGVKF